MRKDTIVVIAILMMIVCLACQQPTRRGKGIKQAGSDGFLDMILNIVLPGSADTPYLTRLTNKLGYIVPGFIVGLPGIIFGWFKFFRKTKTRDQRISEYIGDQKHKFAIDVDKEAQLIGGRVAERIIYDLGMASDKQRTIALKSGNEHINFNISVEVEQVQQESLLINTIRMNGDDPQGKSVFTGFITFKDKLMEIRMEQTYLKNQKKDVQSRICYFSGRQNRFEENLVQGEWWIEGQQGTNGAYSGKWTFSY